MLCQGNLLTRKVSGFLKVGEEHELTVFGAEKSVWDQEGLNDKKLKKTAYS